MLGDEKEYLCRCNNKLLRSILSIIDKLITNGQVVFTSCSFQEQKTLTPTYTDVGVLDDDVQKLYSKYIMGVLK